MERLDFASVMAVLRRNIPDENLGNQADFSDSLFVDVGFSPQTAMDFDQGQVCRWMNGLARLSPNIISFYQEKDNQWRLLGCIKSNLKKELLYLRSRVILVKNYNTLLE